MANTGHKLLQYRTKMYTGYKETVAIAARIKHCDKMRLLAKCGVYKRKLRKVMDQVERELYGRTRADLKDLYFNVHTTTAHERITFFNALSKTGA